MSMKIGEIIKTCRKGKRLTRKALGELLNISPRTIEKIENSKSANPSWYTVCRIADALEADIREWQIESVSESI